MLHWPECATQPSSFRLPALIFRTSSTPSMLECASAGGLWVPGGLAVFGFFQTSGDSEPHLAVESHEDMEEWFFTVPVHDHVNANVTKCHETSGDTRNGKKKLLRLDLRRREVVSSLPAFVAS